MTSVRRASCQRDSSPDFLSMEVVGGILPEPILEQLDVHCTSSGVATSATIVSTLVFPIVQTYGMRL